MLSNPRNTLSVLLLVLCPLLPVSVSFAGQVTSQDLNRAGSSPMRTVLFDSPHSMYRGFQFSMSLADAVKHSGMDPSEVSTLHNRPAIIQRLEWNPERFSRNGGFGRSCAIHVLQRKVVSGRCRLLERQNGGYERE